MTFMLYNVFRLAVFEALSSNCEFKVRTRERYREAVAVFPTWL